MFPHKQSPSIHLFNCLSNSRLQRQWSQSQLSQGGGRVPPGQATCLSTIPNLIHTNGQLRITNKPNVHFFFEWWWEACGFRKSQLFKIYKYIFTSQTCPLPRSNPSITT